VNTNYLRAFPVLDASGRQVEVDETSSAWIVLVPEKYRAQQADIINHFQCQRTGCDGGNGVAGFEQALFGKSTSNALAHQSVSIVWTEDKQEIFSFDPNIAPESGNLVNDPIIEVMTSANSLDVDRLNAFTGSASTALKVKLVDDDTRATLESLRPTLQRLKLDDNLGHLVTMDEYASGQMEALDEAARGLVLVGLGFLVGLLVMAVQLQTILFGAYSRRIVVRRLFGEGFVRTYRERIG
jgi:putative ABC transport system permease protein